jgi:peptidoglycan/xylan/chitin deacetylase (PgdA/CDA1 family)
LLYHSIADDTSQQQNLWGVRREIFAAHLAYLHTHGYRAFTVSQLIGALDNAPSQLAERPVVISFDDGLADFYTNALPILADYGFVATLYITTSFVGGKKQWPRSAGGIDRPTLSWSQLADIHASGIECGAHSHTHSQLDILTPSQVYEEITRPKSILEEELGQPVTSFAYPHGYYNRMVRKLVQEANYSSACAVKHAMSHPADDRFALSRIIVSGETDVCAFAQLLAGQGLRVVRRGERLQTKLWRFVRWSMMNIKHNSSGVHRV